MKFVLLVEFERWSERSSGSAFEDVIGVSLWRVRIDTESMDVCMLRWARVAMARSKRWVAPRLWAAALFATLLIGGGAMGGDRRAHSGHRRASEGTC